jgi:hypothetical protein
VTYGIIATGLVHGFDLNSIEGVVDSLKGIGSDIAAECCAGGSTMAEPNLDIPTVEALLTIVRGQLPLSSPRSEPPFKNRIERSQRCPECKGLRN